MPLPFKEYYGLVQFIPIRNHDGAATSTRIVWRGKIIPNTAGRIFCCGGFGVYGLFKTAVNIMLKGFKAHLEGNTNKDAKKQS